MFKPEKQMSAAFVPCRQEQGVDHLTADVTTLNKRLEGTHKRSVNLMHKGIFY